MSEKSIELRYTEGKSDKVYQVTMEAKGDGFIVNFAYGRRGSTLALGSKTAQPVSKDAAEKVFGKLVLEKKRKGYVEENYGQAHGFIDNGKEHSGISCQKLVKTETTDHFVDSRYAVQEKHDGERRLFLFDGTEVRGINKLGFFVPVLDVHTNAIKSAFKGNIALVDGELVGEIFYAFDLLTFGGDNLCQHGYFNRLETLNRHIVPNQYVKLVRTAFKTSAKVLLINDVMDRNGEGVVFKNLTTPYSESQMKHKFYEEASFLVGLQNPNKRSVAISLLDENSGTWVSVGNVTIPSNRDIPESGSILEVKYLYAFQGGSVYQPTYNKPRNDVLASECVLSQLKYKPDQAVA